MPPGPIFLIAQKGITGEAYNVCSGEGYSLRSILDFFKKQTEKNVTENIDPLRIRKIDELMRIGDPEKINKLGWTPSYNIEETLAEILQYWRANKS